MSNYQQVKDFIFSQLRKLDSSDIDISSEIDKTKLILAKPDVASYLFGCENINLSDSDWSQMQNELETKFNVKMDQGILITGKEEESRDRTWWTGKHQKESDCYYWNRYNEHLQDSLPPEVVKTIDVDTDIVMNNIENPDVGMFDRRGMVVGHVQSGKTGNYTGLICKAADAGYKFIVVIAGGMNNLRNQTQERLNEGFVGKDGGFPVGVGIGNAQNDKLPISLTTKEQDFNTRDADRNAQSTNFDNTRNPVVLVIKKNTNSLKSVIGWLDRQYPNKVGNHAMLMIDDESDYASIDTSKPENEPTAINKGLRKILAKFNKSVYVAYTATPYANIFIDHEAEDDQYEDDLFPRDFIYALNEPDNYFGARKIFLDPERKYLKVVDDYQDVIPAKHKKDIELPSIPDSLYEAVRVFLLNVAIRNLRAGQADKHNSMLIHATRFTAAHQKIANHVEIYLNRTKESILVHGGLSDASQQSNIIQSLENTFYLIHCNSEFPWSEVLGSLYKVISSVGVREVHQQASSVRPLVYRKDVATNAIVVGGTSLSRGYTLEGLSVSYFLRTTVFYDTLMQMGRWFGYREGYQDLCKIYLTEDMIDNFGHIIESTEDLIDDLKKMSTEGLTPKDFGLAVKAHPDSILQVTARNKQRNVTEFVHSICLDGKSKETSWLSVNPKYKENNLLLIKSMIQDLQDSHPSARVSVGNHYLWREIDKRKIIDFFTKFKVYQNDSLGISSRMPIDFIKKYANSIDTKWDVAIYSGDGDREEVGNVKFKRERRKVTINDDCISIQNRQVSSGSAESIALDSDIRKKVKSSRREAREKLDRPLLMLHILEARDSDTEEIIDKSLAAFGVSFPSKIVSNMQNVSLKINTVYQQQLLNFLEDEENDD